MRNWDYRYTWVRDASFTHRRARRERVRVRGDRSSSTSSPTRPPGASPAVRGSRSCTASAASASSPSTSSTTLSGPPRTADRCGSATARGTRPSSTCTASCSTRPAQIVAARHRDRPGVRRVPRRRRRPRGAALERRRRGHLGGARRRRPLPLLEAHELGRARPRGAARRRRSAPTPSAWRGGPSTATASAPRSSSEGWSDAAGAFTQAFGRDELDASVLMMPIVGFLPADDPRMRATIEAIADRAHRRARLRLPLPQRGRPARRRGHLRHLHVLAGRVPGARRRGRPGARRCSSAWPAARTTSGCSPRRSTRPPASCSATSRRRSRHIGLIHAALAIEGVMAEPK